jgi:hypothetical protein
MCAIISDIDLKRDPFGIPGFVIPGDLFMSVRPARGKLPEVNDWDMIMPTWPQGVPQEGESVIADPSGIDVLQYPIVEMFSAYGINPDSTSSVNAIVKYVYGTDFTLVPRTGNQLYPQSIQWLTSNRPQPGSKYVLKYSYMPQLIVFTAPKLHIERGDDLGRTCLLRKRSIVLAANQ